MEHNIISALLTSIEGDNKDITIIILNSMKIKEISTDESDRFFSFLIKTCNKANAKNTAKSIYEYWDNLMNTETSLISLFPQLFFNKYLSAKELVFLDQSLYPEYIFGFMDVISDIIQLNVSITYEGTLSESQYHEACDKLILTYGEPTIDIIQKIYNDSFRDSTNNAVTDYFANILRQKGPYAEIPQWMIIPKNEILVKESDIKIPIYDVDISNITTDSVIDILLDNLKIQKINKPKTIISGINYNTGNVEELDGNILAYSKLPDKTIILEDKPTEPSDLSDSELSILKSQLINKLNNMNKEELDNMLQEYIKVKTLSSLQNDDTLFRIMGPAAPLTAATSDELINGGDRMFYSYTFEGEDFDGEIELDDDIIIEWFTGWCYFCNKRIRRKWHAVREPIIGGGWEGCYCSFNCVRDSINYYNPNDESLTLTYIYENQMNKIGIFDRIPDKDYVSYLIHYYNNIISTNNNFPESKLIIIFIYQDNCDICSNFIKDKELFQKFATIVDINANDYSNLMDEEQVNDIPFFIIYKNEEKVSKIAGYDQIELLQLILYLKLN